MTEKPTNHTKGSVGEGEVGKKSKTTQHTGGQSVSEKSRAPRFFTSEKKLFISSFLCFFEDFCS